MKTERLKKRMAFLLILLAGGSMTARPGVIITGILDGTLDGGCPKAIEIFVTGTVNLNYYEVWRSLNGGAFGAGSGSISSMSGIYTDTFVYLVKTDHVNAFHDVFGNEGIFANVVPMGIINGNGNDGFQVRQKVGSVVIDQVWYENASNSYEDSYWYRKHGTGPDGGWLPSNWETPGNNALDDLDQDGLQAAVPFGTYAMAWRGLTSDWNNSANWSLGIVPTLNTNVVIHDTAAIFPEISNLPASPAICKNLVLLDTASLTVLPGKALTVKGDLILDQSPPEEEERGLILDSDTVEGATGSLIFEGNSSGLITVKRFLAKDNHWHYMTTPVINQPFQPEFVPVPMDNSFDLYYWDEASVPGNAWINSRTVQNLWNPSFGDMFLPGVGYLISYSEANPGNLIRTFRGQAPYGNLSLPVGYAGNHWNLFGNPYTCSMDWSSDGVNKANVAGNAVYIWDPALNGNEGGYRVHNGITGVPEGTSPLIPSAQGFFVQASDSGWFSVDISVDQALVHDGQPFYKDEPEIEMLRLRVSAGSRSDEMLFIISESATPGYDECLDAIKLFNGRAACPAIYSILDSGQLLCIDQVPAGTIDIALGIEYQSAAELVLDAFDFAGLDPATGILLEDKLTNQWVDLRIDNGYSFFHDPATGDSRFVLHLVDPAWSDVPENAGHPSCWFSQDCIYIANPAKDTGKISLVSMEGKSVQSYNLAGGQYIIRPRVAAGIYLVRIETKHSSSCNKIIIY